ncbi:solute carrier family 53 member 1-like [Conger conger]|uniref:solute carrier family 53 member 1-like n=1 Tax=Conger conger TaxID=82655 RepID=UPI002A59A360|nr:solute carrier family 53 member 1-like [Conger conger]
MKSSHSLATLRISEWEKQYVRYGVLKTMLAAGERGAHWNEGSSVGYQSGSRVLDMLEIDVEASHRHCQAAQDGFFQACDRELVKVNLFYSEKLTEAHRWLCSVRDMVQAGTESRGGGAGCSSLWTAGGLLHAYRQTRRRQAERELRQAIRDVHLSLVLLQNYRELNYAVFCKIMKKHDASFTSTRGLKWRNEKLDVSPLHSDIKPNQLISELESLMCHLTGGDRMEAMKRLQVPTAVGLQPVPGWAAFRMGVICGLVLALLFLIIVQVSQAPEWTALRPFLQLYKGGFLLIQFIFLLGVNMHIWKKAGVNYVLIFELDPRDHLSNHHLFEIAGCLALCWGVSFLACLHAPLLPVPLQLQPLVFYSLPVLLLLNPTPTFHSSARRWLITLLCRLLFTPFHPVTFAESWLADQLNSLSPLLLDLWGLLYFYTCEVDWGDPSTLNSPPIGRLQDRLTCLIQCLPPWLRFTQCLRKFWDSGNATPHLLNAGKYSTVFLMVAFAGLYSLARERPHLVSVRTYLYLWAVATCLSVLVTITWDLRMDWGLLQGYGLLREEMVYRRRAVYYSAMLADVILRVSWALNIVLAQMGNSDSVATLSTLLAPLEVFRRFIWNIFRVECEHLNNCYHLRVVPELHLTPLTPNHHSLLESIMDQEDLAKDHGKCSTVKRKPNLTLWCPR